MKRFRAIFLVSIAATFFAPVVFFVRAQTSPDDHSAHHSPQQQTSPDANSNSNANNSGGAMSGGNINAMSGDMSEMMRQTQTPPKEIFPTLMQLPPDLPPEKRDEIKKLADEQTKEGNALVAAGLEKLSLATQNQDFAAMREANAQIRRGQTLLENALAAQRVLAENKNPQAAASLAQNCAACHTPGQGFAAPSVNAASCIACHANNETLLQRQPTAFHANLTTNCASCHVEHQGADANLRLMNHEALVQIGSNLTVKSNADSSTDSADGNPLISQSEARLNCASCHSLQDKHQGSFGVNCASCHATSQWTIPQFQHPSPNTVNCAQCHQAPPSHFMGHFEMVDRKVTNQKDAQVQSCYVCHQTTVWNDIKGIGFFKMH